MSQWICLVVDVWDPARGGLERYAAELCGALRTAGRRVRILCGRARAAVPEGVELIATGRDGAAFLADVDRRTAARDLGRLLSFRHPGAHADVFLPLGGLLVSSLAARRRAEPALLRFPRALARRLSPRTRTFLARERAFFQSGARLVLAGSALVRDEIRRRFPHFKGRIEITGLPLDERRFRPPADGERARERACRELPETAPVLGWVGNDPVRKGLWAARAVLRRLQQRQLDAHLCMVGHGTERFDRRARGLHGLGHVADPSCLYRAADVLLAPSLEDNVNMAVLEALATGLPVVTTRTTGAAAHITGPEIGRVVADARDVHALDGATLALLERGMLSPQRRAARRRAVESCFRAAHFARMMELLA